MILKQDNKNMTIDLGKKDEIFRFLSYLFHSFNDVKIIQKFIKQYFTIFIYLTDILIYDIEMITEHTNIKDHLTCINAIITLLDKCLKPLINQKNNGIIPEFIWKSIIILFTKILSSKELQVIHERVIKLYQILAETAYKDFKKMIGLQRSLPNIGKQYYEYNVRYIEFYQTLLMRMSCIDSQEQLYASIIQQQGNYRYNHEFKYEIIKSLRIITSFCSDIHTDALIKAGIISMIYTPKYHSNPDISTVLMHILHNVLCKVESFDWENKLKIKRNVYQIFKKQFALMKDNKLVRIIVHKYLNPCYKPKYSTIIYCKTKISLVLNNYFRDQLIPEIENIIFSYYYHSINLFYIHPKQELFCLNPISMKLDKYPTHKSYPAKYEMISSKHIKCFPITKFISNLDPNIFKNHSKYSQNWNAIIQLDDRENLSINLYETNEHKYESKKNQYYRYKLKNPYQMENNSQNIYPDPMFYPTILYDYIRNCMITVKPASLISKWTDNRIDILYFNKSKWKSINLGMKLSKHSLHTFKPDTTKQILLSFDQNVITFTNINDPNHTYNTQKIDISTQLNHNAPINCGIKSFNNNMIIAGGESLNSRTKQTSSRDIVELIDFNKSNSITQIGGILNTIIKNPNNGIPIQINRDSISKSEYIYYIYKNDPKKGNNYINWCDTRDNYNHRWNILNNDHIKEMFFNNNYGLNYH